MLVPRRADGGQRDRVWRWLKSRLPFEVFEGHHDDGPFNRSAALNAAAVAAGDWDVAIVNDADCLVPADQLHTAAAQAFASARLVLAFDTYHYLSRLGTERVLNGCRHFEACTEWSDQIGNSPVAVPRALWDRVGGFDERFIGWGYEDVAFVEACGGADRIAGPLFHQWHEPGEREAQPHFLANRSVLVEHYLGVSA